MHTKYKNLIEQDLWFQQLPHYFQQFILKNSRIITLKTGNRIFYKGEKFNGMYAVLAGRINLGYTDQDGHEMLMMVAEPLFWLGEIPLIDQKKHTLDAIAATQSQVLHINDQALQTFLTAYPECWYYIFLLMAQKIRPLLKGLEHHKYSSLKQRLAWHILMISQRYKDENHINDDRINFSQEKLALVLPTSRQTLNGLLKELEQEKIISIEFKSIKINDLNKLKAISKI